MAVHGSRRWASVWSISALRGSQRSPSLPPSRGEEPHPLQAGVPVSSLPASLFCPSFLKKSSPKDIFSRFFVEREKHRRSMEDWLPPIRARTRYHTHPAQGSNPQPRHVPWPRNRSCNLSVTEWRSNPATPAGALLPLLYRCLPHRQGPREGDLTGRGARRLRFKIYAQIKLTSGNFASILCSLGWLCGDMLEKMGKPSPLSLSHCVRWYITYYL